MSGAPPRGWLRPAVGVLVAAAFMYLTLRRVEWPAVQTAWRTAVPSAIAIGLVALVAGWTARIVRWWMMLRVLDPALSLGACARPFLASFAVNNTMPLRAGDVLRAFAFRGNARLPAASVVGTLIIERVLDVTVLLALFFVGLVGVARGAVPTGFIVAGGALLAACLLGMLVLVVLPHFVEAIAGRVLRWQLARWRWGARLHGAAKQCFGVLTCVLARASALKLLGLSLVGWALEGAVYASVAWAVHSDGSAFGPWFAVTTATLATLLPSSPGHVGTFDYFAMVGLMAYGAGRTAGAAFALLIHLMLWLPSTIVGTVALVAGRRARRAAPPVAAARLGPPPAIARRDRAPGRIDAA